MCDIGWYVISTGISVTSKVVSSSLNYGGWEVGGGEGG